MFFQLAKAKKHDILWKQAVQVRQSVYPRGVAQSGLERCVRDAKVGGSNPLTPTISFLNPLFQLLTQIFPACFVFLSGPHTGPQPRKERFNGSRNPESRQA